MLENKKISFIFILLCTFLLGGFIGTVLWVILLPVCFVYLITDKRKKRYEESLRKLDAVDLCIILICISEVLSFFLGVYLPNSARRAMPIIIIAFFWFFFRDYNITENSKSNIMCGLSVIGAIISVITIVTFFVTRHRLSEYGMMALNDYKKEITPLGFPINDWASFLLCLLPYPFIMLVRSVARKRIVQYGLITSLMIAAILLTLSRSAYLVIAIFYLVSLGLCLVFYKKQAKEIIIKMVLFGMLGCVVASPGYKDILTTCAMNKTTSQLRSNEGRVDLARNSFCIWKESPIVGVGGGNYNLAYDYKITDRRTSRSRATNVYLLILVEKGLLGLIAYMLMIIVLLVRGFHNVKNNPSIIFVYACLLAYSVRGIFFSSLFEHKLVMMLVAVLAFVVSGNNMSLIHEK